MGYYDGGGASDVGFKVMYYCTRCEVLFELSPIAPLRCPHCYCDPRYIIGPIPATILNVNDHITKQRKKMDKKYHKATRR